VKSKVLILFILIPCAARTSCLGQVCLTSSLHTLVCQLPSTVTALENLSPTASRYFTQDILSSTLPIDSAVATQLTQLPIPSAAVGAGSTPEGAFGNLGPILADRPDTIRQRQLFVGFSFQHFSFNSIDGVGMGSLPLGFTFRQPGPLTPGDTQIFFAREMNNVGFQLDQFVGVATYGATPKTDVLLAVPFDEVSTAVRSSGLKLYVYDSVQKTYLDLSLPSQASIATTGSALGFGDVISTVKHQFFSVDNSYSAAIKASLRFPSGDALNYLGTGSWGGNINGLLEYKAQKAPAPHVALGYQWNGASQLVNLVSGSNRRLPGGLQYDVGVDEFRTIRNSRLSLTLDLLGSQYRNAQSFDLSPVTLNPSPASIKEPEFPATLEAAVQTGSLYPNTYTTANLSAGLKWQPPKKELFQSLVFYANVLAQLNNVGLRSDLVPLIGVAYTRSLKPKHSSSQ